MSTQDLLQLPKEQQWEYAALTWSRTAGFFGAIGAKENLVWNSTLEDEGAVSFQQSPPDLLYTIGRAGWELTSSATTSNVRGGTTHELVIMYVFKQRVALNEEHAVAQLINPVALLKRATKYVQHNPSLAMKAINRALSFEPQQRELYYLARGRIYLTLGDENKALEDFSQAVKASSECGEGYMEGGNILLRRKDYQNAIDNYNRALDHIRDDSGSRNTRLIGETRYSRAVAYREVGKFKDAAKDFKEYVKRVQLDPQKRLEVEEWIKDLERRR